MSALDRVLQRAEALNFDNLVVALVQNLKRYGVMDKPIETDEGSVIEVLVAICEEMDLLECRILRIEDRVLRDTLVKVPVEASSPDKGVTQEDLDKAAEAMQTTIDGAEVPHAEVAEKANPAPKKPAAKKAAK